MSGFTDYHAHFVYGVDDGAQTREEMYAMLERCIHELGLTIMMVSHDLPRVFHEVHQVLYLAKGKQMFFGETEDFLKEHPEVIRQGGIL